MNPETLSDLGVLQPLRGSQHDPGTLGQRLRARPPPLPGLKLSAFLIAQNNLDSNRCGHTPPIT